MSSTTFAPRAAYQGEPGAFGEAAVIAYWRSEATPVPTPTFSAAVALVCEGRADFAVVPVWNSSFGPIGEGLHALAEHAGRVNVVDAIVIPVRLCLLGLGGATVHSVRTVASHRAALGQCLRFFAAHTHLRGLATHNTARAAYELSWLARPREHNGAAAWYAGVNFDSSTTLGVIASARAAEHYGLSILAEGIQDNADNRTRFVIVRRV